MMQDIYDTLGIPARVFRGELGSPLASAEYEIWTQAQLARLREWWRNSVVTPWMERFIWLTCAQTFGDGEGI